MYNNPDQLLSRNRAMRSRAELNRYIREILIDKSVQEIFREHSREQELVVLAILVSQMKHHHGMSALLRHILLDLVSV